MSTRSVSKFIIDERFILNNISVIDQIFSAICQLVLFIYSISPLIYSIHDFHLFKGLAIDLSYLRDLDAI